MARICVVGSCNVDLITYAPRLPVMGETLKGTDFKMGFGGKGANQAVAAAKLGASVSMVGRVGDDVFGKDTLHNFQKLHVDATHVHVTAGVASGVAPITVDASGANSILIVPGANDRLAPADVAAAAPALRAAGALLTQLEVPVETTVAALRLAREAGVRTIMNPAPAQAALPAELYRLADFFCPNETEAALLTGVPVSDPASAERAAAVLLERGARSVLITLGAHGSLLATKDGATHVAAPRVTAVDTTGAGDCFLGAFAYFLAAGCSALTAIERATAVASVSVQHRGTQTSYPSRDALPAGLFQNMH